MAHFNQLVYILFISFLNYALRKVFLLLEKLVRHQYEELKCCKKTTANSFRFNSLIRNLAEGILFGKLYN